MSRRTHKMLIPAVLGRPSSYNPITALGSDLIAWWDADSRYWGTKGGITIGTGVASWLDIVAGYAATQASGSAQPAFSATSWNGAPGLTADGIDDVLTCTDAALLAALPTGATAGEIWVLTQNNNSVSSFLDLVSYADAALIGARYMGLNNPTQPRLAAGVVGGTVQSAISAVTISGRTLLRGVADNPLAIYVDGTQQGTGSFTPATDTPARLRIFGRALSSPSNYWNGLACTVMLTKGLSASKATALTNWLVSRR